MYLSDWRRSLRDSPAYSAMPASAYRLWFNELGAAYLGDFESERLVLPDCVSLMTLRNAERPSFVVAWCLLDRALAGTTAVVYAYTKKSFRGYGFGSLLLGAVIDAAGDDAVVHALRPREWVSDKCRACGFEYLPLSELMRASRSARAA